MKIWRDAEQLHPQVPASILAIGVFDGLHRGHQQIIQEVRKIAGEWSVAAGVVTFDPHPAVVLAPERAPRQLATPGQRLEGFAALGLDVARVIRFDEEQSRESARSFIERVLVGELGVKGVVVGEDFRFGHNREGDVQLLREEGERLGFDVLASPIHGSSTRWSSTEVRRVLTEGNIDLANEILGRPFTLRGVVQHGDARGRDLGYPTANLGCTPRQQIPGIGIYAGATRLPNGEWWPGAISIGTRPQFYENGELLVEVHIPGFKGDLYDEELNVAFLSRLRGEMKFDGLPELVAQIDRDTNKSLEIFRNFSPSTSILLG